ncbi:hypothetical protein [Actinacidiphila yeochonensis]|uniref:hypothetical protein n=1 Tax=Actinacidiphila yeochonensis TaxID=89050 RepID=UPI0007C70E84|nr:hypothetical protein [Actinacidiphila yeochonensis]
MDPISAAALTGLAGGVGGEAGRQAWTALGALVHRPFRHGAGSGAADDESRTLAVSSGAAELAALVQDPGDVERAQRLSTALAVRAALSSEFRSALESWWEQAQSVRANGGVENRISGGTQHGPVLMGRDFSGITITGHGSAGPRVTPADSHGTGSPASDGTDPSSASGPQEG